MNGVRNHDPSCQTVRPCSSDACPMVFPGSAGPALPAEIQNEPGNANGDGSGSCAEAADADTRSDATRSESVLRTDSLLRALEHGSGGPASIPLRGKPDAQCSPPDNLHPERSQPEERVDGAQDD